MGPPKPRFFVNAGRWRAWLERNHDKKDQVWVGMYKVGSGKPCMTWSEAVDEAICFGWIDGIRKTIDRQSYMNRFTPRRPGSNWSAVNVRKVAALRAAGRMAPPGLRAFETRDPRKTQPPEGHPDVVLAPRLMKLLRSDGAAWKEFNEQPPWYRRAVIRWIMSAKREETRGRRLATLVQCSRQGKRVPPLTSPGRK